MPILSCRLLVGLQEHYEAAEKTDVDRQLLPTSGFSAEATFGMFSPRSEHSLERTAGPSFIDATAP
jgi:hypothetical protein